MTADTDGNVGLWIMAEEQYYPVLSIPAAEFQRFSLRPLVWLRYVAGAIYGHEGDLSASLNGPTVDYNQPTLRDKNYYFTSPEPADLLDPEIMHDRQSYSTHNTTGRGGFRREIIARDQTCIITGTGVLGSQACHIIPHAKGDSYLNFLRDSRLKNLTWPLTDINDPRNGLLLNNMFHPIFGMSVVAFMPLPNFAMTMTDVICAPRLPSMHAITFPDGPPQSPTNRLTLQYFRHDQSIAFAMQTAPHNCDVRISDHQDRPPPQMFDLAYAAAALETWGQQSFLSFARDSAQHYFETHVSNDRNNDDGRNNDHDDWDDDSVNDADDHEDEVDEYGDNGSNHRGDSRQAEELERKRNQGHQRRERVKRSRVSDSRAGDTLIESGGMIPLVLAIWQKNSENAIRRGRQAQEKRLHEDIKDWRSAVAKEVEMDSLDTTDVH